MSQFLFFLVQALLGAGNLMLQKDTDTNPHVAL